MFQTQRERITEAAVPLQRSHRVVAVSQIYIISKFKKKKNIRRRLRHSLLISRIASNL